MNGPPSCSTSRCRRFRSSLPSSRIATERMNSLFNVISLIVARCHVRDERCDVSSHDPCESRNRCEEAARDRTNRLTTAHTVSPDPPVHTRQGCLGGTWLRLDTRHVCSSPP